MFVLCGLSCGRADEALSALEARFSFHSIQREIYRVKFTARPDAERFQILRVPSVKWPKRENFYLKVGEVSADKQFRVKSFAEKQAKTKEGIIVDASELEVVYLPDETLHTLVKGVEQDIPTPYAELVVAGDREPRLYVKEGAAFKHSEFPDFKFTLVKVTEEAVVIRMKKTGGIEKEFTVSKKTDR